MMVKASRGVESSGVVCPKPRRVGAFFKSPSAFEPVRPPCLVQFGHQSEACDSEAGNELLDIILTKGGRHGNSDERPSFQMEPSSPFFSGSPPSRASNPLIQDAHFGREFFDPFSPTIESLPPQQSSATPPPLPSSSRKNGGGGCGMKFGSNQAPARRIEGFNCGRNCSISAMA